MTARRRGADSAGTGRLPSPVVGMADGIAEWRSQRWMARCMERFGVAGLAAAAATPGLSAAVDQHAAAVRDILLLGVEGSAVTAGVVLLAAYARGLLDQAGEDVDAVRQRVGDGWSGADWTALRLLAVCALSRCETWRLRVAAPPVAA